MFINRVQELARLEEWWAAPSPALGLVWGRRRVGKTALLQEFARTRFTLFHVGRGVSAGEELRSLTARARDVMSLPSYFRRNAFRDWTEAFEILAEAASAPHLLVLDEFPELQATTPELGNVLRSVWQQVHESTGLRILLCGSAVRTMEELQTARAPLYGRFGLALQLHPLRPHEAAEFLPDLPPGERAVVWGICGGTPLYLRYWDQSQDRRTNLLRLFCRPGGALLNEGELVLAQEGSLDGLSRQILSAIALGKNRYGEIVEAAGGSRQVAQVLTDLERLRLIERVMPVTDDTRTRSGRTTYRIADNFLAFWLGVIDRYRTEIERGLGEQIVDVVLQRLDDHMGPRWEEAFREHLRRLIIAGAITDAAGIVAVGPYWTREADPVEIDAVVLAGQSRTAVLVGEAKWAREVDGAALRRRLEQRARRLPRVVDQPAFAVAARSVVHHAEGLLAVTADDVFS